MEPLHRPLVSGAYRARNEQRGARVPDERDAGKMIQQRQGEARRNSDSNLDEARLRQQAIGVKLRQMFDEVVNEPVPDEFLDILRRADADKR